MENVVTTCRLVIKFSPAAAGVFEAQTQLITVCSKQIVPTSHTVVSCFFLIQHAISSTWRDSVTVSVNVIITVEFKDTIVVIKALNVNPSVWVKMYPFSNTFMEMQHYIAL